MTSLLKWLATNAINWDIGWHSALGTQEPQGQGPSLPWWWFNRTEAAHSSQLTFHRKPSWDWSQGCNWMWQYVWEFVGWHRPMCQLLCPDLLLWCLLLPNLYHFGCYRKNSYKKIHLSTVSGMDGKIFSHQFLVVPECPTCLLERDLSPPSKSCSYYNPDRRCFKTLFWGQTDYFYQPPSETTLEWERPFMDVWSKYPQISNSADGKSRPDYIPLWGFKSSYPPAYAWGLSPLSCCPGNLGPLGKPWAGLSEDPLTNPEEIW